MFNDTYTGRRVLVTGHTGFKGSWLALWLTKLGARVAGYSDRVPTSPAHFDVLNLGRRIDHHFGDVRDRPALLRVFETIQPDIVLHLAAQSLVRESYADPATTFETNVMGTVNVLECVRQTPSVRAAVIVTSDKCYRNVEWPWGYRETDTLGGHDPYSGSKGAAELVAFAYHHSFFNAGLSVGPAGPASSASAVIATARAGNVIGGGDWAADRIVPDCVRAWARGEAVPVRSPEATRPWQHVLEPLSGYLTLGAALWRREPRAVGASFNFGPNAATTQAVRELIDLLKQSWPGAESRTVAGDVSRREARLLKLSCERALAYLQWQAALTFEECVRMTGEWYRAYYDTPARAAALSETQIDRYVDLARARHLAWTT
jgi:CDP-glucose 4,6-dehydratase